MITDFEWDDANISHIAKHNVSPEEAEDVFFDPNQVIRVTINTQRLKKNVLLSLVKQNKVGYYIKFLQYGIIKYG